MPSRPGGGQLRLDEATVFVVGDFDGEVDVEISLDNESWFPIRMFDEPGVGRPACSAPMVRATMRNHQRGTANVWLYFP